MKKKFLNKPPKLVEVRSSGSEGYGLTKFQLIFENGIVLPLVDSESDDPGTMQSFELNDKRIAAVGVGIIVDSFMTFLRLTFDDGTTQHISEDFHQDGII